MVVLALVSAECARSGMGSSSCDAPAVGAEGIIANVAPIIVRSCAQAGCHDAVKHEHGMDLSTPTLIHENLVAKRGFDHCTNRGVPRVVPGDPAASYLMTKIAGADRLCGSSTRMPPPPLAKLPACEIESIRAWIAAGAPPPEVLRTDGGQAFDGGVAGDDAGDDVDPDPSACTSTKSCEPYQTCAEMMPVAESANCYTRWECLTHAPEDGTLQHPCAVEIATFCGCDGTSYEASYTCPTRPYDHIGSCGEGYSCDAFRARCSEPQPACPDGEAPAVVAGCWGPCVPIGMCRCDQNWQCPQRDKYRCLTLPEFRCAPIPPADAGADGLEASL